MTVVITSKLISCRCVQAPQPWETCTHDPANGAPKPTYPYTPTGQVANDFSAPDFLPCLEKCLHDVSKNPGGKLIPTKHIHIELYKSITIHIPPSPQVTKQVTKDVVWARWTELEKKDKESVPAQFDTVLVHQQLGGDISLGWWVITFWFTVTYINIW